MDNQTRARAFHLASQTASDLDDDEAALLTSERYLLADLSKTMCIPLDELLHRLWSSDVTEYRAAAIVARAQQQIVEAQQERKRKAEEQKRKNKIGRKW